MFVSDVCEYNQTILKDTDVICASYPRSGNTWMRLLLSDIILQTQGFKTQAGGNFIPDIYKEKLDIWNRDPRVKQVPFRIVKSHEFYDPRYIKIIYLFRKPADALCSLYHYWLGDPDQREEILKQGIDDFCKAKVEQWQTHVESYLEAKEKNTEKILFISYESLSESAETILTKTTKNFLGLKKSTRRICKIAVEHQKFEELQKIQKLEDTSLLGFWEAGGYQNFFRKGKVNSSKDELKQSTIDFIESNTMATYNLAKSIEELDFKEEANHVKTLIKDKVSDLVNLTKRSQWGFRLDGLLSNKNERSGKQMQIFQQKELEDYKLQLHQTQEELEQSQSQLHQTQGELEQSQSQLHQTQGELEQSQSQLHQTQEVLEQSQSQLHQTQGELEQSQSQLHQTQGELEQSQSQLHQTQGELEQSQSQLHQTQGELEQSQSQLHQTQEVLEQSQSQLHQTQEVLEQYQSQLHQTQEVLEQYQSQLHQTQGELEQSQSQLHQTQGELEQSQSQLYQTQEELEQSQSQLHQTQGVLGEYREHLGQTEEILEQYQSQLHQTKEELQQIKSQLEQKDLELDRSRFQMHQTQAQLAQSQVQLHQTQEELKQLKAQFSLTQVELVRTQLQQQYVTIEPQLENAVQYKLLVWDAWYAYQNGDLKKMQQCLQESLKLTSVSLTESLLNWLESFSQFSAEKGQPFDTYKLTNSQEWKRLMQRRLAVNKL